MTTTKAAGPTNFLKLPISHGGNNFCTCIVIRIATEIHTAVASDTSHPSNNLFSSYPVRKQTKATTQPL